MDINLKQGRQHMDTTSIKDSVDGLSSRIRPQLEKAQQHIVQVNGRITSFIQDHPVACLLGALAMGYLVARVARHQH
jgi:hypothetical protein